MKRFAISIVALVALGAAAPAVAAEDGIQAAQVQTADLNLADPADAATLLGRIGLAASRACEPEATYRPSTAERRAVRACREQAVARTVEEINAPTLTQMYLERREAARSQIASR